ncbi:6779_t:CDS:1, partial [Dentiscutata heterogama]
WCGNIQNIGGSEMFKCNNCGIKIEGDVKWRPRNIPSGFA